MFATTKRNSWVDKNLTKSPKKKGFEKNGATKNWVEEELSKFPNI